MSGKKHTQESREKMRKAHLGKVRGPMSEEGKAKIRLARSKQVFSLEARQKMRLRRLGTKQSEETKSKIGRGQVGEKNPAWKGGVSKKYNPEYQRALLVKPDQCEVCSIPERDLKKKLHFDHDHVTGLFRGWLCRRCNVVLGLVSDKPEILTLMIDYLNKNKTKKT